MAMLGCKKNDRFIRDFGLAEWFKTSNLQEMAGECHRRPRSAHKVASRGLLTFVYGAVPSVRGIFSKMISAVVKLFVHS